MKINQIIVESDQLDELNAADVGRGIGTAVGKTAGALGGVAGGVAGIGSALKKGYQAGKAHVGGQEVGRSYSSPPRTTVGSPPPEAPSPATAAANPPGGGNTGTFADMDDQELEQLRTFVDRELQLRRSGSPPGGPGGTPPTRGTAPQGATPTSGATPPAGGGGNNPPSGNTGASRQPTRNQIIQGPDGRPYQWLGNQWAAYNPSTGRAGQVARRDVGSQLSQAVARGTARPYSPSATSAGASRNPGSDSSPPGAPATGSTSEQQWEQNLRSQGYSDAEIEQARGPYRARQTRPARVQDPEGSGLGASRPAVRPDDYDWVPGGGIGPETRLGDIGPSGERTRNRQAASESFPSRFLGRNI